MRPSAQPPPLGAGPSEVELGRVIGVFGFRGEVRVYLHHPDSDLLRTRRAVVLEGPDGTRRPAEMSVRPGAGQRIIGRIVGVDDEASARALDGWRIVVPTEALPALPEDEVYVWQLQGAAATIEGARAGTVVDVQRAGPNDVLEIELPDGDVRFVPLIAEFVRAVRADEGVVELHAGALEEG